MPDVFFFTDLSKVSGFGHFIRSLSLAEEFKKKNINVSFFSNDTSNPIKKILKKKKIPLLTGNNIKIFKKNDKKIAIIDSYNIKNILKNFINTNFFSVTFDDFDNNNNNKYNIVISNSLGFSKKKNTRINHLIGKKYFIIRKELSKIKILDVIDTKPRSCYITLGGGYIENKLINFIRNLINTNFFRSNPIKLYINTNSSKKKVKKIFDEMKNIKVNFVDMKLNNNFKFNKIDMSINAGGITSGEMLFLKIPQIVILESLNQKHNINFIKKKKLGLDLGNYVFKKKINIDSDINKFINNYVMFKKNLINNNYIDSLGSNRIVSTIIRFNKNEK